ncbi:ribosomal large subunit pseudouridine synthase C [Andreesenia angusta]|uniref:Pseudouridine synthase n=1 Tax=Andreesenia angusta TaxID=39480 RepID=A0A1S1V6H1_9FIRM|nr:RluA family pseudouridine synthase [Andreesenia angusta]OHW62241.1 ribosomal large subunit pseudouridine synthase C [Andreesenia angusta]
MKEIKVGKNESEQRIDRFLKKYMANATKGYIYKMLRKKRIKLNGKRANPEDMISEGDIVTMYLADETIDKFKRDEKEVLENVKLDIIYEDENIIMIDKPKGVLSHSAEGDYKEENIVSQLVSYLYHKGEYVPRLEKAFTPSICNRLDRNTSGILIGAKNYETLKCVNEAIKNRKIDKFYRCIVVGRVDREMELRDYLEKDESRNMVSVSRGPGDSKKEIVTVIRPVKSNGRYSLLEVELITGRTHQIRAHLASKGNPIIGDRKYGNSEENKKLRQRYGLDSQYLHAYRLRLDGLSGSLEYLNGKEFVSELKGNMKRIEEELLI